MRSTALESLPTIQERPDPVVEALLFISPWKPGGRGSFGVELLATGGTLGCKSGIC